MIPWENPFVVVSVFSATDTPLANPERIVKGWSKA
jgi:hypothetical protein